MRILSIDGGGIRGILPGLILVCLEEKLKIKSGNPNARLGDFFDLVAGTSTGAILSAAYLCPNDKGKPKFSAQEAVNFYLYAFQFDCEKIIKKRINNVNYLEREDIKIYHVMTSAQL